MDIPIDQLIAEYEQGKKSPFEPENQLCLEIDKYDGRDRYLCTYCMTLPELAESVPHYAAYYYRPTLLRGYEEKTSRKSTTIKHFGVQLKSNSSFKLSLSFFVENWLNFLIKNYEEKRDKQIFQFNYFLSVLYRIKWYKRRMDQCALSSREDVENAIDFFLRTSKIAHQITDLKEVEGKSGVYFLVLDEYNVCYIGQAADLKKRILNHWSTNTYHTGTGIDMFRALDTTRIYAAAIEGKYKDNRINKLEYTLIDGIPPNTTLNFLSGGKIDYLEKNSLPLFKRRE